MDQNRIEGGIREGVGAVKQTVGEMMGDRGTEIAGQIDELAGHAQRAVGRAMDQARDTASYVADYAGDYAMEARDSLDAARVTLADYVRANPVIALGAAFAVGLFLGSRR